MFKYANKRKEGVEPSSTEPQSVVLPLNYNRHVKTREDKV